MDFILAITIGAGTSLAILCSLVLTGAFRRKAPLQHDQAAPAEPAIILLDGGDIVNVTDTAQGFLDTATPAATWQDLHSALQPRFAGLPSDPPDAPLSIPACDTADTVLNVTRDGTHTRVTIDGPAPTLADQHSLFRLSQELDLLRAAMATAPHPAWQCDASGRVMWCNAAYERLRHLVGLPDPDQPIFDIALPQTDEPASFRLNVRSDDARHWFEVSSARTGTTWLNYAANIDAVVHAEVAQRNFVQTLTKTFAHLPIGLAVFDRERRLALFNPALMDRTQLPVDFLSRKPNLMSFFDNMRENRMMPEPKNYANWREQLAHLIAAASDDRYCETWSMPSGLTYKITGRPHPDGAIAFLLEDISAEISLTRRFRSELDLSQSVLDSIDDAIVVFNPLGTLTFCNEPYRSLWQFDPESSVAEVTIIDATRHWQSACKASPIWGDIRDYILTLRERAPWDAPLRMSDGKHLTCHVEPVSGGATVVRFSPAAPQIDAPAAPRRTQFADA